MKLPHNRFSRVAAIVLVSGFMAATSVDTHAVGRRSLTPTVRHAVNAQRDLVRVSAIVHWIPDRPGASNQAALVLLGSTTAKGRNPTGVFFVQTDETLTSGEPACIDVWRNTATVVFALPAFVGPDGLTRYPWLGLYLVDKGTPGTGRDTTLLMGGVTYTPNLPFRPNQCLPPRPSLGGYPITDGNVTIKDVP